MNGPVNAPVVEQDYLALKNNIETAISFLPARSDRSKIVVNVHPKTSQSTPNGGLTDAVFLTQFNRELNGTPLRLQVPDMMAIVGFLDTRRCINKSEARMLRKTIANAVNQQGWSRTP